MQVSKAVKADTALAVDKQRQHKKLLKAKLRHFREDLCRFRSRNGFATGYRFPLVSAFGEVQGKRRLEQRQEGLDAEAERLLEYLQHYKWLAKVPASR